MQPTLRLPVIALIGVGLCLVACGAAPAPRSPDRDGDGVADADDLCPDDLEDVDGVFDHDGCPDVDNDRDGHLDVNDRCPDQPETVNRWRDDDGCPDTVPESDVDTDADGVPDPVDACPRVAEDIDRFEDDDGCPDPDNDRDGIPDAMDMCPMKPEPLNGVEDEDGCPDGSRRRCHPMGNARLEMRQHVRFESGAVDVPRTPRDILTELAEIMTVYRETRVVITGHADDRGTEAAAQRMSMQRAQAVHDVLVAQGVHPRQLVVRGAGSAEPITENRTARGRAQNRRVEFTVARSPCLEWNPRYRSFFPDADEGRW